MPNVVRVGSWRFRTLSHREGEGMRANMPGSSSRISRLVGDERVDDVLHACAQQIMPSAGPCLAHRRGAHHGLVARGLDVPGVRGQGEDLLDPLPVVAADGVDLAGEHPPCVERRVEHDRRLFPCHGDRGDLQGDGVGFGPCRGRHHRGHGRSFRSSMVRGPRRPASRCPFVCSFTRPSPVFGRLRAPVPAHALR